MRMGFSLVDITPEPGLIMAGRNEITAATGIAGPLCGRVLLAEDAQQCVAIVALDLMALPAPEVATVRERLARIASLDPHAVMVACSHTHAAPLAHLAGHASEHDVVTFLDGMIGKLEIAMRDAVADLHPVTLRAGRIDAPDWAFNRRPIYANDQVATHGLTLADGFAGMESTADDELQVMVARGEDGSIRGGLVSFACHPTVMEMAPVYSSDFAGVLCAELESRLGGTFCFLLGASGDTANPDPADRDQDRYFGWEYAQRMGRALADHARAALAAGQDIAIDRVAAASTILQIRQRRPTPEQVILARWYLEEAPPDLDEPAFTRRLYGHDHTFFEVPSRANERHARELLGMWEWQRRAGTRELIEDVEMQVMALGEVAIVAYPVELFTDFGRVTKRDSPFPLTMIATQANGWHGYVPTVEAFARGGYEPFLAYQSRLIPEAGAMMNHDALDLLRTLREWQAA
jgi:hypothetical protein